MIIADLQIAVHIKNIRNLTGYTSGRFAIRLSFESPSPKIKMESVPVNIIEKDPPKSENRSQSDERYYNSKTFLLKSGLNVQLNEVCLFKVNSPIFNSDEEQLQLILNCQLIHIQQSKSRLVDKYRGRIYGSSLHEYLEIDFYEAAPCQIIGSIHVCNYKYEFTANQQPISIRNFCEGYNKFSADEVLNYLSEQSIKNYKHIAQSFSLITKKSVKVSLVQPEKIEKSLQTQKSQKSITLKTVEKPEEQDTKQTQLTEFDEEPVIITATNGQKKKRKKIFGVTHQTKIMKYDVCQKVLHQYSQKIYQIWRELIPFLLTEEGDEFVNLKGIQYRKKLKQKVGQSIARFKGSWDIDIYCDQEQLRAKLAYQLRNQDREFFKDIKGSTSDNFPIVNESFFSNLRPIFFQQIAVSTENQKKTVQPLQILVIMVHGLGACRLDMQKLKVQLRRYYDRRIRIYISTSNEGRTQGDIENMGMRLATQIEYQLSKYEFLPEICLLGHSMGGVIIRSALPRLEKFKNHFHSLITLSSPHLGYAYSSSKLVDAGLWLMNTMKKCCSILQLTMQDNENIEQTFIYKLSKKPGLEWFKKLVLLASHQDLYVPYYSARIQKHEQSSLDYRKNIKKGVIYCQMIDNMLSKCKGQIIRVNINFCIPQQNLDNLIGRAAHISFINNVETVRTLILAGPHYFL